MKKKNKINKISFKHIAITLVVMVLLLGATGIAKADISFKELLAEKLAFILGDKISDNLGLDDMLGGQVHNAFETFDAGIGVNGTTVIDSNGAIIAVTDVTSGDDVLVGDDIAMTGDLFTANTVATLFVTGSCEDSTTTVMSLLNPVGATSTLEWIKFEIVGATTTADINIGVATSQYGDSAGDNLIDGYAVSTSTSYSMVNGDTNAGTNSKANVILAPTNYITGLATLRNPNFVTAFTEAGSTFSCTYKAKFVY